MTNGVSHNHKEPIANGIRDLALLYVVDNKTKAGGMYASTEGSGAQYEYEIHAEYDRDFGADIITRVVMINNREGVKFEGSIDSFYNHVLDAFE